MSRLAVLRRVVADLAGVSARLERIERRLDDLALLQARALLARQEEPAYGDLHAAEFKVFSQFGEDGILQHLVATVGVPPAARSFVEFGVEDYTEANTRLLLVKDNWRGLVIDGVATHVERIRCDPVSWLHDLTAVHAFVDRDNVDELIRGAGFTGEIGVLSIDVDGNDYWIWERLEAVAPLIVVIEYNAVFGPDCAVTVPYRPDFERSKAHWSHLYWGASLGALCLLADRKGYAFVGCTTAGNDAFFVRRDRLGTLRSLKAAEGYVESRFRDSRDPQGRLSYIGGADRRALLADLPVHDLATGGTVPLREARPLA